MKLHYPLEFRHSLEVRLSDGTFKDVLSLQNLSELDQLELLVALGDLFPFMPDTLNVTSGFHPDINKVEIQNSVTFFGGSFHPFHRGHLNCLESCPEQNIIVVPDCNPHKVRFEERSPYETFTELCTILRGKPFSIYPGFLGKNVANPTVNWITRVQIAEVNFLMGDDSFMNFFKWTRPEEILRKLTKLYIVPRDFERTDYEDQLIKVKAIAPRLEIIILPDHPFRQLSSTSFRTLK